MAVVRRTREEREYRIVCKGVSVKEYVELQREIEAELGAYTARRNPFLPEFDAKAVHEIFVRLGATGLGIYAGKKANDKTLDILVDLAKRKLEEGDDIPPRSITIYDHHGKPRVIVEVRKPLRRKR